MQAQTNQATIPKPRRKERAAPTRLVAMKECTEYGQYMQDGHEVIETPQMRRGKRIHKLVSRFITFNEPLPPHFLKILPKKTFGDDGGSIDLTYLSADEEYDREVKGLGVPIKAFTDFEYRDENGKHVVGEVKTGRTKKAWHFVQVQIYIWLSGAAYGKLFYVDTGETFIVPAIPREIVEENVVKWFNAPRKETKNGDFCDYCARRQKDECSLFVGRSKYADNLLLARIDVNHLKERKEFLRFEYLTEVTEEIKVAEDFETMMAEKAKIELEKPKKYLSQWGNVSALEGRTIEVPEDAYRDHPVELYPELYHPAKPIESAFEERYGVPVYGDKLIVRVNE